jgi:hypothetical protein
MKINYVEYPTPDNSNILGLPIESAHNNTKYNFLLVVLDIQLVCLSIRHSKLIFFRTVIVVVCVIYLKNNISKIRKKKKKKHTYHMIPGTRDASASRVLFVVHRPRHAQNASGSIELPPDRIGTKKFRTIPQICTR